MQRQLRLGDILDDYCPRERRLTNHAIVAMVGDDVKQTRCTTCDAEHEYKHAHVPRQRRKDTTAGLTAQVLAGGPKRPNADGGRGEAVASDQSASEEKVAAATTSRPSPERSDEDDIARVAAALGLGFRRSVSSGDASDEHDGDDAGSPGGDDAGEEHDGDDGGAGLPGAGKPEGPAHRRLIRATLPRLDGQPPVARQAPDFTIRTPATGRPNKFRPRPQQQRTAGQPFASGRPGQGGGHGRPGGGASRQGNHNGNAGGNRQGQGGQSGRRFDNRNNKRSK